MNMDRRGFLGAMAGVALAGPAVLDKLAELARPDDWDDYNSWPLNISELLTSSSVHEISDITAFEWQLNASYLYERGMKLRLKKSEDRAALEGHIHDTLGGFLPGGARNNLSTRFAISLRPQALALDHATYRRFILRQLKYQAQKSAESIEFSRRTGWTSAFVDAPGNSLHGRLFYRHLSTRRVQFNRPQAAA